METTVAGLDVRVQGSGEPMLLVHGSGGGLDSFAAVAAELRGHEVWTFCRRAYGRGPAPETFAAEVPDVRAVLDAIGRPAVLAGVSLGATLALHTARDDPSGIRGLALFEPPLLIPGPHLPGVLAAYRDLATAGHYREASVLMAQQVTRAPAEIVDMVRSATPELAEAERDARGLSGDLAQLAADTTDVTRWASIALPVLLLQGADTWSPLPESLDALAAVLPHARRIVWDGLSHFASAEAPARFAAALADFAVSPAGPAR